ncbi:hypothetical protein B0T24DRAFT_714772 [Lasiosphaeria ovina]|uniref:Uncharacterized protein n=1 Tax=Lasiosphaeria ovina TaxID=92902 RepID=A0AAE0NJV5_9PEZI|nr:hypothetical protein B0T24DRAFT_714772 [Lasiosphaeria ovina]
MGSLSVVGATAQIVGLWNTILDTLKTLDTLHSKIPDPSLRGAVPILQRTLERLRAVHEAVTEELGISDEAITQQPKPSQPETFLDLVLANILTLEELNSLLAVLQTRRERGMSTLAAVQIEVWLGSKDNIHAKVVRLEECLRALENYFVPDRTKELALGSAELDGKFIITYPVGVGLGEREHDEKADGCAADGMASFEPREYPFNPVLFLAAVGACVTSIWGSDILRSSVSDFNMSWNTTATPTPLLKLNSALHSPSVLVAAIATTSLSLTAHHYILDRAGKQRDGLLLSVVGTGVVVSLALGLNGITILLRVAPWLAISAFLLSAVLNAMS